MDTGQRPSKKYGRTAGTTHTQWNQLASFKKDVITAVKTHTPWNPASFKKNDSTLSTVQKRGKGDLQVNKKLNLLKLSIFILITHFIENIMIRTFSSSP